MPPICEESCCFEHSVVAGRLARPVAWQLTACLLACWQLANGHLTVDWKTQMSWLCITSLFADVVNVQAHAMPSTPLLQWLWCSCLLITLHLRRAASHCVCRDHSVRRQAMLPCKQKSSAYSQQLVPWCWASAVEGCTNCTMNTKQ